MRVTLLEQNSEVGGRAQSLHVDSCRFDTGPSLLLFPDKYREAFAALGSALEEHVDVQRVQPAAYRVFFGDNSRLDLLYDVQAMMQQLEAFEAGAGAKYLAFLAQARAALEMGVDQFIDKDFTGWADLRRLPGLLPLLTRINLLDLLGQHDSRLSCYFKDPRLRALFSFQDLYVGLSPYTAPAVFSLLAATELTDGVWYPMGGFGKVRDGLGRAAEACGVVVRTGAEVTHIHSSASGVSGVSLANGEFLPADIVVANRDLPAAYPLLRTAYGDAAHAQLASKQYSAAVISYNWCLDKRADQLLHHNVFLSDQYEKSWHRARSPDQLQDRPNLYIHAPARTDPSAAPAGSDSIMVLLPVANMQETGTDDYRELVDAGRDATLRTLQQAGIGNLRPHIKHERVISPPEWRQRYALQHGAAFGMAHGLDQLAVFRPPNKDSKVEGLYFVGASTRPGNGVPLVLISARLTAERILTDYRISVQG
ncbi:hypothetical protein WJX72_004529 [[Myrmecia] bisecta]|uniref:Amine oxidase domain-containing protein n=1 Tax=[Myrmecia] bisecta TaxID=41462 RepID=A0AAW1QRG6_9CHLO